MPRVARGHVEQLPSGSFRAVVDTGVDPLTRRPVHLKATARTEKQAQAQLGKLLGKASDGRRPESEATMAKLTSSGLPDPPPPAGAGSAPSARSPMRMRPSGLPMTR
jgi:hypothetical protein